MIQSRILLLTLEFSDPLLSGNGVYARAIAGALSKEGLPADGFKQSACLVVCAVQTLPETQARSFSQNYSHEDNDLVRDSSSTPKDNGDDGATLSYDQSAQNLKVLGVNVPSFGRLDAESPWKEYGVGISRYVDDIIEFQPNVVIFVDWSSVLAVQTLKALDAVPNARLFFFAFRIFSRSVRSSDRNAKLYAEKEYNALMLADEIVTLSEVDLGYLKLILEKGNWDDNDSGKAWHVLFPTIRDEIRKIALERKAMQAKEMRSNPAFRRVTSSWGDSRRDNYHSIVRHDFKLASCNTAKEYPETGFLSPDDVGVVPKPEPHSAIPALQSNFGTESALRNDKDSDTAPSASFRSSLEDSLSHDSFVDFDSLSLEDINLMLSSASKVSRKKRRRFLTCCSRMSEEKNVLFFVQVVLHLRQFLDENGVIPCLVGPRTRELYADKCHTKIKLSFPGRKSKVIQRFVDPGELSSIFSQTVLNFHPATYEPFGISMLEAAAFGAPTVMNMSGIGASGLLVAPTAAICVDMSNIESCARVLRRLLDPKRLDFLEYIGASAQRIAIDWDSAKYRTKLFSILNQRPGRNDIELSNVSRDSAVASKSLSTRVSDICNRKDPNARKLLGFDALDENVSDYIELNHTFKAGSLLSYHSHAEKEGLKSLSGITDAPTKDDKMWIEIFDWILGGNRLPFTKLQQFDFRQAHSLTTILANLPEYELAKKISKCWNEMIAQQYRLYSDVNTKYEAIKRTEAQIELDRPDKMTKWAVGLFPEVLEGKILTSVSKVRYKMVPVRMSEIAFWYCFFVLVKEAIQVCFFRDSPYFELQKLSETSFFSDECVNKKINPMKSIVSESHRKLLLKYLAEEAGSLDALKTTATALCSCHNLIILTGCPSIKGNSVTYQKADGPLAVVQIIRAVISIRKMKSVRVLVEQCNSHALQSCLATLLSGKGYKSQKVASVGECSEELVYEPDVEHNTSERYATCKIVLEVFYGGKSNRAKHMSRLRELANTATKWEEDGEAFFVLSIERSGPAVCGRYYLDAGDEIHEIDSSALVPLHELLSLISNHVAFLPREDEKVLPGYTGDCKNQYEELSKFSCSAAIVSSSVTNVGMGLECLRIPIETLIPHGATRRCSVAVEDVVIGVLATSAAYALSCAIAVCAVRGKLCEPSEANLIEIVGTEEDLLQEFEAMICAGSSDGVGDQDIPKTLGGLELKK